MELGQVSKKQTLGFVKQGLAGQNIHPHPPTASEH